MACDETTPRPGAIQEAAKAAALAAKAAAKAAAKSKRAEGQARVKREQALNATMAAAEMDAVVRGRGAASAEKQARVKADVAKHERKRKRQWSAEKQRKEQARASPAHANRTRTRLTRKEQLAAKRLAARAAKDAKRARRNQPRTRQAAHGPGGRPPLRMDANSVHQHAASQTADDHAFAEGINAQQQIAMALIFCVLIVIVCWVAIITMVLWQLLGAAGVVPVGDVTGLPGSGAAPVATIAVLVASNAAVAQSGTEQEAFGMVAQPGTQPNGTAALPVEHTVAQRARQNRTEVEDLPPVESLHLAVRICGGTPPKGSAVVLETSALREMASLVAFS